MLKRIERFCLRCEGETQNRGFLCDLCNCRVMGLICMMGFNESIDDFIKYDNQLPLCVDLIAKLKIKEDIAYGYDLRRHLEDSYVEEAIEKNLEDLHDDL